MLKIVEIIPILSIRRGAETFFANLCVALKKRNDVKLDVVLLYDEIDSSFVKTFEEHGIKPFLCHKTKGVDFKAAKLLKKILLDLNPDIIHTHNCCFFTYYLAFGSKKMAWKYFHTCHSVPDVEATKIEHFFRRRFSKRGLITNIGISPIVSNGFKERYKIEFVPYVLNGIPLVDSTKSETKKFDFIICASFDENKNQKLLIEAFRIMPNYKNYKLVCLGDGPLLNEVKNLSEKYGLSKNVFFLGAVSNVGDYLSQSKVFVLSSKNEGIPVSILEAMNYGLPIIAPNIGGIPDFISSKNGILFDVDDKDALSNAMYSIVANNQLLSDLSFYNKEYSKKFSIDKTAEDYLNIFKEQYEKR